MLNVLFSEEVTENVCFPHKNLAYNMERVKKQYSADIQIRLTASQWLFFLVELTEWSALRYNPQVKKDITLSLDW